MVGPRRGAAIVGIPEHVTQYAPDKSKLQIQGKRFICKRGESSRGTSVSGFRLSPERRAGSLLRAVLNL